MSLVSSVPGFSELLYTAIQMYLCVEYVCIQCVVNPTVNAQQVCFLLPLLCKRSKVNVLLEDLGAFLSACLALFYPCLFILILQCSFAAEDCSSIQQGSEDEIEA